MTARMQHFLHLHKCSTEFSDCGAHFQITANAVYMHQPKAANSFRYPFFGLGVAQAPRGHHPR